MSDLINLFKRLAKNSVADKNLEKHFDKFAQNLFNYLSKIDKDLLFITISYLEDNVNLYHSKPLYTNANNKASSSFIKKIYDEAKAGLTISLTKLVLNDFKESIILYKLKDGTQELKLKDHFTCFNLSDSEDNKKVISFMQKTNLSCGECLNKTLKIFQSYNEFGIELNNNFFAYLLRPFTKLHYHQMVFIATKAQYEIQQIINIVNALTIMFDEILLDLLRRAQLKTAIISILIDSYAHNISAHSLAALKWWIELRHKIMDKRFSVPTSLLKLNPHSYFLDADKTKVTTKKYYEALGLTDSSYDEGFYSLYDFLQFADSETSYKLFSFTEKVKLLGKNNRGVIETKNEFNPRFPVPIDNALFPFFRFLRDKGAFWSGVTRDASNGGETKTWYKILWEDFANNPLYLGTIAKSEGITKININLAVKTDEEFYHGRFVTIDLSIIDYEEKLANDPNLELKEEDKKLLETNHKEEENCKTEGCKCSIKHKSINEETNCFQNGDDRFVETKSYSKYAFIRLGKCFAHFREILDTEEFTAYLPGGIIGEHALFTIFENQIRNIKHYKNNLEDIKNDGIDFWISIEKDKLNINSKQSSDGITKNQNNGEGDKDKTQLFKVGVWIAHATDLRNIKKVDDKPNYDDVLIKKVTDSTIKPILDDNGSPRMGGNSQDKACAAMLFNNEFKAVERKINDKEKRYFPWITFATASEDKPFDNVLIDNGKSERYVDLTEERKKNEYINEYLKLIGLKNDSDIKTGYLKKHFYLWQGSDYIEVTDVKDLEGENVSRFKFAIVNIKDKEKRKDIILKLRRDGVIRILEDILITDVNEKTGLKKEIENKVTEEFDKNKDNSDFIKKFVSVKKETNRRLFKLLYSVWLGKKWLKKTKCLVKLTDSDTGSSIKSRLILHNSDVKYIPDVNDTTEYNKYKEQTIPLSHGSISEEFSCNVRSHGHFWGKFFDDIDDKQVSRLKFDKDGNKYQYPEQLDHLLFELIEIFNTQIIIYDNRIWERFDKLSSKKREEVFEKSLRLIVRKEEKKDDNVFKNELSNLIGNQSTPTVLIMHLSFIESFNISEEDIEIFIKKYLKNYFDKNDNFIFVVTTGRGRDLWRTSLENKGDYAILRKTLFKPVESLLNAVETGISYNDNFDVKYNLIKVIFGS